MFELSSRMPTSASGNASPSVGSKLEKLFWLMLVTLGLYVLMSYIPRYLAFSEDAYTPYYWPRATYVFAHLAGGVVAILVGPFQFSARIREQYLQLHRVSGRVYVIAVLVGGLAGMYLSLVSAVSLAYAGGLFGLSVAWLGCTGMAVFFIFRRDLHQHRQWMQRSYVVTLAFVVFRVSDEILGYMGFDPASRQTMMSWGCWAFPLLINEMVMQCRTHLSSRTLR